MVFRKELKLLRRGIVKEEVLDYEKVKQRSWIQPTGEAVLKPTSSKNYKNQIIRQSVSESWPLPNESIDVIVTSPPYWRHRDYGKQNYYWFNDDPNCPHKIIEKNKCKTCKGQLIQLGQEKDPREFIKHLVDSIHNNAIRCLRPDGQLWLNIGDTYSRGMKNISWGEPLQRLLIPYRVAIALQEKGWILRSELIWAKGVSFQDGTSKGGGMPSSVHDRLNQAHEPFFGFVKPRKLRKPYFINHKTGKISWKRSEGSKTKNYFSNLNAIRIPHIWVNEEGMRIDFYGRVMGSVKNAGGSPKQHAAGQPHLYIRNHPLGKNPGSVWQINLDGFTGQKIRHTAPYPQELIRKIIKFGSPKRRCSKCKLPLSPILDRKSGRLIEVDCGCNAPEEPSLIFDPFMGSGTTAIVAIQEQRNFCGLEINQEFIDEAKKRIEEIIK